MRSEKEIKDALEKALKVEINDYDRQGGIIEALRWVLGNDATGGLELVLKVRKK